MIRLLRGLLFAVGVALGLSSCEPEHYAISVGSSNFSLAELINDGEYVLAGTLAFTDRKELVATLRNVRVLKGTPPSPETRWALGTCSESELLRRHIVEGAPVVIFGASSFALVYINRLFIPMYRYGSTDRWVAGFLEGQWNQSYNGSVVDLPDLIEKLVKGEVKAPPPDPSLPPVDISALRGLPDWDKRVRDADLPKPLRRSSPVPPRPADQPTSTVLGVKVSVWGSEGGWHYLKVCDRPDSLEWKEERRILRFDGFLEIPKTGYYVFTASCDPGCSINLKFGETTLGLVGLVPEVISLTEGKHAVSLELGNSHPNHLKLFWTGPDLGKEQVPAEAWSHSP